MLINQKHFSSKYVNLIFFFFRKEVHRRILKKNPLKNFRVMVRLNPYAKHANKQAKYVESTRARAKEAALNKKRGVSYSFSYMKK